MTARAVRAPQLPPLLDVRVLEQLLVELSDEPVPARLSVVPAMDTPAPPSGVPAPDRAAALRTHPESRSVTTSSGTPRPDDRLASRGAPAPGRGKASAGTPRPVGAPSTRAEIARAARASRTDGERACIEFLRFYVDLWPNRWERVDGAVHRQDRAAAMDACLSVKSSSAMVGALRLSWIASLLEDALRAGNVISTRALLAELGEIGERSMDAMRAWIRAETEVPPD